MAAAAMLAAPALAAVLRWGASAAAAAGPAALLGPRPAAGAAQAPVPAPPAPAAPPAEAAEERDNAYDDLDHLAAAGCLGLLGRPAELDDAVALVGTPDGLAGPSAAELVRGVDLAVDINEDAGPEPEAAASPHEEPGAPEAAQRHIGYYEHYGYCCGAGSDTLRFIADKPVRHTAADITVEDDEDDGYDEDAEDDGYEMGEPPASGPSPPPPSKMETALGWACCRLELGDVDNAQQ
ncbi:unnamed protein product [Prorocentrum cordatum]|uniref:Uncharacterized protein n=1 Tax=Prorocentrum cordatum TaxID=2364126 RepID=A0ABN9TVQ2_9DINO|nr:unnamed protein product [Polarella glacialis]